MTNELMAYQSNRPIPKTPLTHPWQSIRVLCRRGLRGYDTYGKPAWMVTPGTWFVVESVSEETQFVVAGETKTMYYLSLLPGQDTGRVMYRACTSMLYEADDLWEVYRLDECAVLGVGGPSGLWDESDIAGLLEVWWDEECGNGKEAVE